MCHTERAEAEAGYVELIQALTKIGLATEVRQGDAQTLIIFVKIAAEETLRSQIYRSRLQDWLYGVRTTSPEQDVSGSFKDDPVTEAERLRIVYLLISKPQNDGGAGIIPGQGRWKYVESVFPLHNHAFNKQWLKTWSSKYLLDQSDLDDIRNRFGESVAFYFAFTQSYFRFMIFPASMGFGAWLLLGKFSFLYALISSMWSVVFFEYWRKKEVDLAVQWGVRNVSNIQHKRPEFKYDFEGEDPVTGETVKVYPPTKRLQTQLLQIPFGLICIVVLGCLIATCNSLEIFIKEVYDGPLQQYLVRQYSGEPAPFSYHRIGISSHGATRYPHANGVERPDERREPAHRYGKLRDYGRYVLEISPNIILMLNKFSPPRRTRAKAVRAQLHDVVHGSFVHRICVHSVWSRFGTSSPFLDEDCTSRHI